MQRANLKCNATNCAFNQRMECSEENMRIDANKASCDTFICE